MSYSKLDKQKPKAIYSLTPSVKNDASSIDEAYILPSFVRSHIGDTRYGDDSTRCPHTPGAHGETTIIIIPIAKPTKSVPSMANRSLPSMANRVSMTPHGVKGDGLEWKPFYENRMSMVEVHWRLRKLKIYLCWK